MADNPSDKIAPDAGSTGDTRARKNVVVLVAAQALLGAQLPINFTLGGLSGQMLSPEKCLATLPISLIVAASMLTAPVMANIMQTRGRRTGFTIGAISGGIGGIFSVLGLYYGSFALFCVGAVFSGVYMSAQGFYRFAATDTASPEFRPKAISYVMAGGLVAAIIAQQTIRLTHESFVTPFIGGYLGIVLLNFVGVMVFAFLDIPRPPAPKPGGSGGRTRLELLKTPRIAVAIICAMVSYALMNLVMTSTPLAVVGCGYSEANAADVVLAHVLAMFVPSFFTGHLIARFGAERIIAFGLVILSAAGVVALSGVDLSQFFVALILLGVGWNFGFIGATAMLAASHTPEERGRVQGMNDFLVFGLVTVASLGSGLLMNCSGSDPVEGWTAVNIAMLPLLALAGTALIWLSLRARRAAL